MKFICLKCGYEFKGKSDRAWYECPKCKGDAYWEKSGKFTGLPATNKYTEVTAFGTDEHGRTVGLTKGGKRVDPSQTRYNFHTDPQGWKAVGKKVREYDSKGNKYGD